MTFEDATWASLSQVFVILNKSPEGVLQKKMLLKACNFTKKETPASVSL